MYEYNANLVRVYDGDTIWVDIDLGFGIWMKNQAIRLVNIDTPEVRGVEKAEGFISRDRVIQILEESGNKCVLKTTLGGSRGKYGRILAEIFVENETKSINEMLLDEGLAVVYGS
jgi:micrococcal nuclease